MLRLRRHVDDRQGAHHQRRARRRRTPASRHQRAGGDQPVRPGSEPRDLGGLQVRHVHEGSDGAGRGQSCLREHALQRSPCRTTFRLPDHQSSVRQGLEARQERSRSRAPARFGRPVRSGAAAHQRRPNPVPAAHANPRGGAGAGRRPHRHHHERFTAVQRRRWRRRERNPPLHPGARSARSTGGAARATLLQYWHRHLCVAADQPQGAGARCN